MEINFPQGIAAVVLGLICFFGSIYVVVALNTGWRFGYWLSSACFGGLMLFLSTFWLITALGPRGAEPVWIPVAAAEETVSQATVGEQTLSSTGEYPGGGWEPAGDADGIAEGESDALTSAVTSCLSTPEEDLPEQIAETCTTAQGFLPASDDVPRIEGIAVVAVNDFRDVEFTTEDGTQLGQVTVVPITRDPRLAEDPEVGIPVGDAFRVVAYHDLGSLRLPALASFVLSVLYFAVHLWGLNRAEKRKLSPVAA